MLHLRDTIYRSIQFAQNEVLRIATGCHIILSGYSPFSNSVGLPLHNILSPLLSIMDIFFVDLKFCHIRFYTLTTSFLVVQPVFCLELYTPYISSLPYHMSIPSQWFQRLPPARGGTAQKKIRNRANWSNSSIQD